MNEAKEIGAVDRVGFLPHFRIIWHYGGPVERAFVLLFFLHFIAIALSAGWQFWATWNHLWPFEVLMSFGLAWSTIGAFAPMLLWPLYSASVLRELLNRGWRPSDRAFLEELIRYFEAHGKQGHFDGIARWGLGYWGLYLGMMGLSIPIAFAFLPVLGPWTPYVFAALDAVVTVGLSRLYGVRARRWISDADARGFRLSELRPRRKKRGIMIQ